MRLGSRNGNTTTGSFPELAALIGVLDGRPVVLDGEVVALDAGGRPDFGPLQRRVHVAAPRPALQNYDDPAVIDRTVLHIADWFSRHLTAQ
ncbi:DNA ligase-like domain-containing protein [Dactylosporangium darangshiense]|uniref:ATP-dependent DNA ligase family profile domain-containing protein n=1 Tax=Dactylosporangium darangshiense TaxID=579108 RepID=A0ABP8DQ68_9ACTN